MEDTYYGASTSSASAAVCSSDEAVISVNVATNVLVDSVTTVAVPIPPDIVMSGEGAEVDDECPKLTLAYEKLLEIPRTIVEKFATHVVYLDISHNKITNLDALVYFTSLTSLIADDNPITENCLLPPLPKLKLLWLNHCKISALYPWVGKLKESCPNLVYLCLMNNPAAPSFLNGGTFYEYLQYRLFVISQFPSLSHLDDRKVTADQREEAQRLYRRPLSHRLVTPGSTLSGLLNKSVSWNTIHTKIGALWGAKTDEDGPRRNLVI